MSGKFDLRPAPLDVSDLPESIRFAKMEGAGNDYIYVEEFQAEFGAPGPLAVRLSDRHFGVGGDGLILIGPPSEHWRGKADFRMRMFNADGSEGEMCGNASRCVGKYLYDTGLTEKTTVNLETKAGLRVLHLNVSGGRVVSVRVDMGEPLLRPDLIPMNAPGDSFVNAELDVDGILYRGTAVSMGNPHLVVPWDAPGGLEALDIAAIGPKFERHPLFPRRVNTEFVEVKSRDRVRMRVWERGSGETLACGTGA